MGQPHVSYTVQDPVIQPDTSSWLPDSLSAPPAASYTHSQCDRTPTSSWDPVFMFQPRIHHDETGIPAISHHTQCIDPAPYFKTQCSSHTSIPWDLVQNSGPATAIHCEPWCSSHKQLWERWDMVFSVILHPLVAIYYYSAVWPYHIPAAKQHHHETQECTNRSHHINITSQDLG